jgi:NADPH-dependent 2,4-dienoyl-CoA reductase/sulfur reductase-like enzyme
MKNEIIVFSKEYYYLKPINKSGGNKMIKQDYKYIIIGAGVAGAKAIEGIRQIDKEGDILLIGSERQLPYDRPPLTKKLWTGKKKVKDIFVHDEKFYEVNKVDRLLGTMITGLDAPKHEILDQAGNIYHYEKLLIATGGIPKIPPIPGDSLGGIYYYRYLTDYARLRAEIGEKKTVLIVGGGFIGSELAASLKINKVDVTMIFPEDYISQKILSRSLGMHLQEEYIKRGVKIHSNDIPVSFEKINGKFITLTRNGKRIISDILIVGIGMIPAIGFVEASGIELNNGIIVNEFLQSSDEDVYAAGDCANFPYTVLNEHTRVEHWDNAINQGLCAGRNMAGAMDPYLHIPYFFSDLFENSYEAVGNIDSKLEINACWEKENEKGIILYHKGGKLQGVMMYNIFGKIDLAREWLKEGEVVEEQILCEAVSR